MGTQSNDFVCNLDCPQIENPPICCKNCFEARKDFVTDANKHLWTEDYGFWSEKGCRLEREDMPDECKIYDCRRYTFAILKRWYGGKWNDQFCLLKGQQVEKCFKSAE